MRPIGALASAQLIGGGGASVPIPPDHRLMVNGVFVTVNGVQVTVTTGS